MSPRESIELTRVTQISAAWESESLTRPDQDINNMGLKIERQLTGDRRFSRDRFLFLNLPLEIRRHIYTSMTNLPRVDHLNFLCSCRKLHDEAQVSFYSRPLYIPTQKRLIQLAPQSSQAGVYVQELKLMITDLDRDVMQPFLAQVVDDLPKVTFQHPYEQESRRIIHALEAFPNVRSLSLLMPKMMGSSPAPRLLLDNTLTWATKQYTSLSHLRIDSSNISLEPISSLRRLRSLCITGFSDTSPSRTTAILGGLPELDELHIACHRESAWYIANQRFRKSVDSETFKRLRPLRVLEIHDYIDLHRQKHSFLDAGMLKAINGTHGDSLRRLEISSSSQLSPEIMSRLAETIRNMTQIQSLSLCWPGIDTILLENLPTSTHLLQVFASTPFHAAAILKSMMVDRERLPRLQKIEFLVPENSWKTCGTRTSASGASHGWLAKGLHVPWIMTLDTWQPFPDD